MNQADKIFEEWLRLLEDDGYIEPKNDLVESKRGFTPVPWPKIKPEEGINWNKVKKEQWPRPTGQEKDPSGKALNELGAKADAGKNRVHLCLAGFSRALEKVAEVTTVGANKYTPNGWAHVENGYERYMDAFGRHYLAYGQGKKLDNGPNGTGCEHMAQMIWNLLAAYELSLRNLEKHDA